MVSERFTYVFMFECGIFVGKKTHYTETLRSISSLIPASFGCVFGMVGKLSEQDFQRVFFHIFLINV